MQTPLSPKMEPTIRLSDAETRLFLAEQTRDTFLDYYHGEAGHDMITRDPDNFSPEESSSPTSNPSTNLPTFDTLSREAKLLPIFDTLSREAKLLPTFDNMPEFVRIVVDSYRPAGTSENSSCRPASGYTRIDTLGLASIIQCAPPGLKAWLYDIYPRAAVLADIYKGSPLVPSDVGSSIITCETIDMILAEYIEAIPRNILPAGSLEKKDILLVARALFSGLGHRAYFVSGSQNAVDQCKYLNDDKDTLSRKDRKSRHHNAGQRVKAVAIKNCHWELMATLELCGIHWTAADQIVAGGKTPAGKLIRYWRIREHYRAIGPGSLSNNVLRQRLEEV